ncbi:MAG: GTP-binding protein [Acidimicrobiia bacterium]|nr:GTP-binding protein [Acidimicrobiia bacterium]
MDAELLRSVESGDRKALARAISRVESGAAGPDGSVHGSPILGITGPPGAGKSTLISSLIALIRSRGQTVGVLAIDPSSPITGGALLGDRIRMQDHAEDDGVFIRSMATRGHLGGLTASAGDVVSLMGRAGFDLLIVETVGVGQSEVEVMKVADRVVLVVGPSWGDQVQADKAGVVEIADIYVVNKGDRAGADEVVNALRESAGSRGIEIHTTTATSGEGVPQLLETIDRLLGS